MQAEVVLHHPNLYSQHCSTQYTFVNVCCGAEQNVFNNVTCNHVKPLSHISQLHPFDAPCWTALPNYGTDARVIQVNVSGSYWDDLLFGSYTNSGFTPVPLSGKTLTGTRAHWLAATRFLICTPRRVIRRQLSHSWKKFDCQSSNQLFSWSGGQLDCRRLPACAWKPEANQCGSASASSALE
ncbi:hypothetical protein O181_098144 [Austropuccinia psidii MF-1]|uniref:Uncharacterized protein n=1 Tax=Austropuccinia psidii MF-1 TaxID=1389203 RepID=A0A9Q3JAM7_9BASI|nr:hypothetical protein [Austropuccinia psidii MF-1]